ncbi:MAG TPA: LPS export ABC transporter periplasmic protein LptC [Gammaproteobacteria bacterium]|nr:LPS export ABC transporter periplasmic protein LptC [Gammaproteobacteria bacterium]
MSWRSLLAVVVLVGAAVASWLLGSAPGTQRDAAEAPAVPDTGYYLEDATFMETGANGSVLYEVAARSAVQSPADETVTLRQVHLDYAADEAAGWVLEAAEGRISEASRVIELSGNVLLRSDGGDEPAVVETETLTVDPELKLAMTTDQVRIRLGPHVLTGTGMQVKLDEQHLELEAAVHGRFVP